MLFGWKGGKRSRKKGNQGPSTAELLQVQRAAAAVKATDGPHIGRGNHSKTQQVEPFERWEGYQDEPEGQDDEQNGIGKPAGNGDGEPEGNGEGEPEEEVVPAQEDNGQKPTVVCPLAIKLLHDLEEAIKRIPDDVPTATFKHLLQCFAGDPQNHIPPPGSEGADEGDWPVVNGLFKSSFGWGEAQMIANIPQMLNRGAFGLDGFLKFLKFFVARGLVGGLIETKVEGIIRALDDR